MSPDEAVGGGPLSAAVRAELVAAGLPVVPPEREDRSVGGALVVDDSDNSGVWVEWLVSGALSDASVRALEIGAWDGSSMHPAIRHSGTVSFTMRDAMVAILTEAGFDVDPDPDDLQPATLLVRSRRPGPTWRSPPGPLAGPEVPAASVAPEADPSEGPGDPAGGKRTPPSTQRRSRTETGPQERTPGA